jgi:hypothetical protein
MIFDIIKASYCMVMIRKTNINKLELLQRYLKMRYNISIGIDTLEKRKKEWEKEKKPC